jgi:dsRNA-specific ribonuclease
LKADSAINHLHHFCDTLPRLPYVDLRPNFTFSEDNETQLLQAAVVLPNCLKSSVRRKSGLRWWRTEHAAMKDAAFQAYVGLHKEKLLTDNLLPFRREPTAEGDMHDDFPSIIEIQAQLNPWFELGRAWAQPDLHQTRVCISQQNKGKDGEFLMILRTPSALPPVRPFTLYWDSETTLTASIEDSQPASQNDLDNIGLMRDITHTLVRSVHSDYSIDDRQDFVALFTPEMNQNEFGSWLKANRGRRLALLEFHLHREFHSLGLVRTSLLHGIPHIFHKWHNATESEEIEIQVECFPLTRRRNFLQRATLSTRMIDSADELGENPHKMQLFPVNSSTFDYLPFEVAKFGLFIPSILRQVEVVVVATRLQQTILRAVPFNDIWHVVEAITASSAQCVTNYQRYEFVGDSILKFIISGQLFVDHKNWHEGLLSKLRASIVSNTSLAKAALSAGLDAFILTKPFISKHWTPPLISDAARHSMGRRDISSKTLADVVEALIGAAFIDGGLSVAAVCIQTFLTDLRIQSPESLFTGHACKANSTSSPNLSKTEMVIGYQFIDKSLFEEALTHPSCERDVVTESYQRLEFLGDAVLDMIVVSILSKHKPCRSHGDMTMIKAALVNANLLAFFCMELWNFMRHHSQDIMAAQQACLRRYQNLRQKIDHSLKHGHTYPWDLLAQMNADKFFSDITESIVGAIFVDSGGSLTVCQRFTERIGLLPYLVRILTEDIEVTHPKTALGHLTGSETVDYVVTREEGTSKLYKCLVRIDGVEFIAVGECLTKDEAIVRAADAAVKLLSNTKP